MRGRHESTTWAHGAGDGRSGVVQLHGMATEVGHRAPLCPYLQRARHAIALAHRFSQFTERIPQQAHTWQCQLMTQCLLARGAPPEPHSRSPPQHTTCNEVVLRSASRCATLMPPVWQSVRSRPRCVVASCTALESGAAPGTPAKHPHHQWTRTVRCMHGAWNPHGRVVTGQVMQYLRMRAHASWRFRRVTPVCPGSPLPDCLACGKHAGAGFYTHRTCLPGLPTRLETATRRGTRQWPVFRV